MQSLEKFGVDIETHPSFERAWNVALMLLYGVIVLIVAAGLLGVFGGGWLARVEQPMPHAPAILKYERYVRNRNDSEFNIELTGRIPAEKVEVALSPSLIDSLKLSDVVPRPIAVRGDDDGLAMEFPMGKPAGAIKVPLEFRHFGLIHGWVQVMDARVPVWLFIYP
jgi:hypothetical protein